MIDAFGIERELISKKGTKVILTAEQLAEKTAAKAAKKSAKAAADKKAKANSVWGKAKWDRWDEVPDAFRIGQKRALRRGEGPMASALEGVGYGIKRSPGTAAVIGGGSVAGVAGAGYVGGRTANPMDRNGRQKP